MDRSKSTSSPHQHDNINRYNKEGKESVKEGSTSTSSLPLESSIAFSKDDSSENG